MRRSAPAEVEARRTLIIESAFHCFLTSGFEETSMDDIAQKAGLKRPLLYLLFRNKGDLLVAIFEHLVQGRPERAQKLIRTKGTKKARLMRMVEILIIEPWERISGHPHSPEFFESCGIHNQEGYLRYEIHQQKIFAEFFKEKTLAQVFCMALNGSLTDTPTPSTLRKRAQILVERFSAASAPKKQLHD